MKLPQLEQIIPLLPATYNEIIKHFVDVSPRGLRNRLNGFVRESKLFIISQSKGKRGKPEIIYLAEKPNFEDEINEKLLNLHLEFSIAVHEKNRNKLISVYQKLGDILLSNKL